MQHISGILKSQNYKIFHENKTESPIEEKLLARLVQWGFTPRTQVQIGRYRVDILLQNADYKVVVECDGAEYHKNIAGYEIDRDVFLINQGYVVEHFSGSEIYTDSDKIIFHLVESYFPELWNSSLHEAYVEKLNLQTDEGEIIYDATNKKNYAQ